MSEQTNIQPPNSSNDEKSNVCLSSSPTNSIAKSVRSKPSLIVHQRPKSIDGKPFTNVVPLALSPRSSVLPSGDSAAFGGSALPRSRPQSPINAPDTLTQQDGEHKQEQAQDKSPKHIASQPKKDQFAHVSSKVDSVRASHVAAAANTAASSKDKSSAPSASPDKAVAPVAKSKTVSKSAIRSSLAPSSHSSGSAASAATASVPSTNNNNTDSKVNKRTSLLPAASAAHASTTTPLKKPAPTLKRPVSASNPSTAPADSAASNSTPTPNTAASTNTTTTSSIPSNTIATARVSSSSTPVVASAPPPPVYSSFPVLKKKAPAVNTRVSVAAAASPVASPAATPTAKAKLPTASESLALAAARRAQIHSQNEEKMKEKLTSSKNILKSKLNLGSRPHTPSHSTPHEPLSASSLTNPSGPSSASSSTVTSPVSSSRVHVPLLHPDSPQLDSLPNRPPILSDHVMSDITLSNANSAQCTPHSTSLVSTPSQSMPVTAATTPNKIPSNNTLNDNNSTDDLLTQLNGVRATLLSQQQSLSERDVLFEQALSHLSTSLRNSLEVYVSRAISAAKQEIMDATDEKAVELLSNQKVEWEQQQAIENQQRDDKHETDIVKLTSSLNQAQTLISSLSDNVSSHSQQLESLQSSFSSLTTNIDTLSVDHSKSLTDISSLSSGVAALRSQSDDYRHKLNSVVHTANDHSDRLSEWEAIIHSQANKINRCEELIRKQEQVIDSLKEQVDHLKSSGVHTAHGHPPHSRVGSDPASLSASAPINSQQHAAANASSAATVSHAQFTELKASHQELKACLNEKCVVIDQMRTLLMKLIVNRDRSSSSLNSLEALNTLMDIDSKGVSEDVSDYEARLEKKRQERAALKKKLSDAPSTTSSNSSANAIASTPPRSISSSPQSTSPQLHSTTLSSHPDSSPSSSFSLQDKLPHQRQLSSSSTSSGVSTPRDSPHSSSAAHSASALPPTPLRTPSTSQQQMGKQIGVFVTPPKPLPGKSEKNGVQWLIHFKSDSPSRPPSAARFPSGFSRARSSATPRTRMSMGSHSSSFLQETPGLEFVPAQQDINYQHNDK